MWRKWICDQNYPKQSTQNQSRRRHISSEQEILVLNIPKEILGGKLTRNLPSKVLISFEHDFCKGFELKELSLASLPGVINGNVLSCLYDNIVRWRRVFLRLVWFVCSSVSIAFGLIVDSIGTSFPSTWFVNTNETCKMYLQMSIPWNGNQTNK